MKLQSTHMQILVKNKQFQTTAGQPIPTGRLHVNIGNIHFKKKDYIRAIKHYRMALDQVSNLHKETR